MDWAIRRARDGDLGFLRDMLREAAYWRPQNQGTNENDALRDPRIARYLDDWGRAGDTAVVAVDEHGEPKGAAWFRFFSRHESGYSFIDEATPELSIAVRRELRGRGIGTSLLEALLHAAREQGLHALSLSVQQDNPALDLYLRFGFRSVNKSGDALTMRVEL